MSLKEYKEILEMQEKEISKFFKYCPLCFAEDSMEFQWGLRKDYMMCSDCSAKWHINYSLTGFKWARLVNDSIEEKEKTLLKTEYEPEFWQRMALKGRRTFRKSETAPQIVKEKQIIREKEVIVKIRCQYCHNTYDESLDRCPHCDGKR